MKITKPHDWQIINDSSTLVVVEDVDHRDLFCLIWTKYAFQTFDAKERPVLAVSKLIHVTSGVGLARFPTLGDWGMCVIGIVVDAETEALAACGIILPAPHDSGLTSCRAFPDHVNFRHVLFPLGIAYNEFSHVKGGDPVACAAITDQDLFWAQRPHSILACLSLEPPQVLDAMPFLRLEYCVGISLPKWLRLQFQSPYISSSPYVARFRDAYVTSPAGVVILPDVGVWSDSTATAFFNDPFVVHHPTLFRAYGSLGLLTEAAVTIKSDKNELGSFLGIPLLLTNSQYNNPAHWLLNSLYPAFLLRDLILSGALTPLVSQKSDYIVDSFSSIGIPPERIVLLPPGLYKFDDLAYPSTLSGHINFFPCPGLSHMFEQIRTSNQPLTSRAAPERIYITRQGSGAQRCIRNENDLITELVARDFVRIAPHELSYQDEIYIFSNAKIIVAQLGAGLINIGFAPPGCEVFEISSTNYTSNDYWFLCSILSHRFTRILIDDGSGNDMTLNNFEFDVPVAETMAAIDNLINRTKFKAPPLT